MVFALWPEESEIASQKIIQDESNLAHIKLGGKTDFKTIIKSEKDTETAEDQNRLGAYAYLSVLSSRPVELILNDKSFGQTPLRKIRINAGKIKMKIKTRKGLKTKVLFLGSNESKSIFLDSTFLGESLEDSY